MFTTKKLNYKRDVAQVNRLKNLLQYDNIKKYKIKKPLEYKRN